jgi:hypothetical protein
VTSPKVTKPTSRPVASRQRGHSVAPEHLGEAGAAAALVVAIGGMAIFIAAAAMTIGGLTLASRYAGSTAPPNVDALALTQVVSGVGLLVLGLVIVAAATALLVDLPRSRPLALGAASVATLLAVAGVAWLLLAPRRDLILLVALAVAAVAFGGSAAIIARPRR